MQVLRFSLFSSRKQGKGDAEERTKSQETLRDKDVPEQVLRLRTMAWHSQCPDTSESDTSESDISIKVCVNPPPKILESDVVP